MIELDAALVELRHIQEQMANLKRRSDELRTLVYDEMNRRDTCTHKAGEAHASIHYRLAFARVSNPRKAPRDLVRPTVWKAALYACLRAGGRSFPGIEYKTERFLYVTSATQWEKKTTHQLQK